MEEIAAKQIAPAAGSDEKLDFKLILPVIAFVTLALSNDNYRLVAFVAAFFSLLSILLTWVWLEESLPPEKRGVQQKAKIGLGAMLAALKRPEVGLLLALMFAQQVAFGGFEQLLALFTLDRLGMNASSNAALFVFVGIIVRVFERSQCGCSPGVGRCVSIIWFNGSVFDWRIAFIGIVGNGRSRYQQTIGYWLLVTRPIDQ